MSWSTAHSAGALHAANNRTSSHLVHSWTSHGVLPSITILAGKVVGRVSSLADFAQKVDVCVQLYKADLVDHRRLDRVFDKNDSMPSE